MDNPKSSPLVDPSKTVSDELFRLLVKSVKDYAIFLLDPGGHVATWNEGAQRIKGYTESEILGHHFSQFYPRSVAESGWPDYELKVAAEEGRFEDEGWRVRKDGTMFWADVVITALRDDSGRLVGFAKVTRDLTERRAAEEALRSSEERYRTMVDAVMDYAIYMLDAEGFVVTWNAGAQRLKGYTAGEIIGKHFSVFYPPERAAEGFPAKELEIAAKEGRFEEENWRVRKDGSRFWANVVLTAFYDRDGAVQGFSKVTRDITERRELEVKQKELAEELNRRVSELGETNRVLAEKNQEVEGFVYSVSHDVRGPLVNLQGFNQEIQRACEELVGILDRDPEIPPETRERARQVLMDDMRESTSFMETSVNHLAKIVDGLLKLSRLGRVSYECKLVDVGDIVRRVARSMQGTIDAKRAKVRIQELPPLWADAAAMEQIFSNLISNALRYSDPERAPKIEISGSVDAERKRAIYSVKDNGLGIPESAMKGLFMAFRRFHPEAGPGEGIGLAMVRRMVERHKGRIHAESEQGVGTTFFLDFPNTDRQL